GMQSGPGFDPAIRGEPERVAAHEVAHGEELEPEAQAETEIEVEVVDASAVEPVPLSVTFAIEEVPPGAMAVARRLAEETGHALLQDVVSGRGAADFQAFNNALMDLYRVHGSVEAFTLLFELNTRPFSMIAARIMRMTSCRAELGDILQETFLAIYRYPTRFCPDKPNAFRNWSYSIIRNTVYRHLQISAREGIPVDLLAEVLPDEHASSPVTESENAESDARCQRVYELV